MVEIELPNEAVVRVPAEHEATLRVAISARWRIGNQRSGHRLAGGALMIRLPASVRVYLSTAPTDMRKSFDVLFTLVQQVFQRDPLEGHLFLFLNRRRDRLKILWWDRDGLALFCKRLESETYQLPVVSAGLPGAEIEATQLALRLNGVDLRSAKRRKRYSRVA